MLFITSLFLILLILIQRGRGGGLSGAFGGAGGQSAFGAKAGDTFTKITVVASSFWIILCIAGAMMLRTDEQGLMSRSTNTVPATIPLDSEFEGDLNLEMGDAEARATVTRQSTKRPSSDAPASTAESAPDGPSAE